ncbi:hypothetical protein PARPLA_00153 [Rhodobacteraceae bacterium THAF1]|uniref:hypothetical protein n=1 Tax=Palleronia sp. THAF1 TaxID=2587842 RepID=UPI000F3F5612|nr:hypothetical protein [Palleronia sp. THAF1]QFU10282.1 hypothetical protein FIU81_16495 [Palleronia sp. THAF1]VDC16813.1 hypothetical protein PARPLA_00153 [Rhodobacteraceae bacterium THAF1]
MTDGLKDLARISAMLRDRELGAVERIVSQLNAIQSDIARLQDAQSARRTDASIDTARLTGMDMSWLAETERRILRLRQQEAALRAAHETALGRARKAFGRADVTARIAGIKPPV